MPDEGGVQIDGGPPDASGAIRLFDVPLGRYRAGVFLVPGQGYVKSISYEGREADRIEIGRKDAWRAFGGAIAFDGGEIRGALQDGDGVPMPNRNVHLREDPPRFDCFKTSPRSGRPLPLFADPLRRVLAVCGRTPGRRAALEQLWECHWVSPAELQ